MSDGTEATAIRSAGYPRLARTEPTLTEQLVRRLRPLRSGVLPEHVVTTALLCVLDTLGVAVAGSKELPTRLLRDETLAEGGSALATLLGSGERVSPRQAALVNGTAAHALDFDDVHPAMHGHPSAAVLPSALAAAEHREVDGPSFLAAFVAGVETSCLVGRLVGSSHYRSGFHATATIGSFGGAAAAAHTLGLSEEAWCRALGLAGTRAAGVKSMFGTMAKPLHAGHAAENGLRAAHLAARGFTAHPDVLGTEQGFIDTQSDAARTCELPVSHNQFDLTAIQFKQHAACFLTHPAVEGLLCLRDKGLCHGDVETIELRVPPGHLQVCDIPRPATPLEAKFSLRFTAALALVTGELSEHAFTVETVADPQLAAIRDCVRVVPRMDTDGTATQVRVLCHDGTQHVIEIDMSAPTSPSDIEHQWDRLATKFRGLVVPLLGEDRAEELIALVADLPRAASLDPLLRCAGHARPGGRT